MYNDMLSFFGSWDFTFIKFCLFYNLINNKIKDVKIIRKQWKCDLKKDKTKWKSRGIISKSKERKIKTNYLKNQRKSS
jgi:hypothetical protein